MLNTHYSYQDIFLKPNYSEFHSRSNADVSVQFGPQKFKLPVVPANMKCVIDTNLAKWMSENGYFYIMHRFNVDHSHPVNQDNMEFVKRANEENWKTISISLGVQEDDKRFLAWCAENDFCIDYITIDIAHAHSIRMKEMIEYIKSEANPYRKAFLIAGNVATPEAVVDLETWGADCVKVGIAQGDACTTYGQTGFGMPMFTCIQDCAAAARKPIIADGGVRMNGDFAKALVAGGTMVMAGSVFASCKDAPGETVVKQLRTDEVKPKIKHSDIGPYVSAEYEERIVTKVFKRYYGSASEYNKGTKHHVEGRLVELACNGMTYQEKLIEIEESLQSSVSYAGGNLNKAEWGVIYK